MLVSLHVLANAITFYVLTSLITGNWTASSHGVSPIRWLACLALPVFLASRSLRNHIVTSSGAIAVLQVGFILTLANLSFALCFGAYLFWYELDRPKTFEPKTYINIILETAVAINVSFLHLLEVGTAGSGYSILGPENPLDFRGNYIQTSLALSVIGSFAICMANDYVESIAKVRLLRNDINISKRKSSKSKNVF